LQGKDWGTEARLIGARSLRDEQMRKHPVLSSLSSEALVFSQPA